MLRDSLRQSALHVGLALREPEKFALRWDREADDNRSPYKMIVWVALGFTAILGTSVYGLTMGIGQGPGEMLARASLLTLAAGLAWAVPLPALYILNSLAGSRLRASTTLLAALVTTSWGGLALVASVPINWFFSVAVPAQIDLLGELVGDSAVPAIILGVNLLVFAGVGVAMSDVFRRVMRALEPQSKLGPIWFLALIGAIGSQLMYLFDLFAWSVI
jgi:hypothetical protein